MYQNSSHSALNLVSRLWLDRKLMWRKMALWQTFTINSAMYGRDRCSQQKLGSTQAGFRFCQTVLPSAVACSHLVLSIHLHSLIITVQVSPFLPSFPFLPLQLWPGRSFHNSTCVATQKVRLSPKFCRNSVQLVLGFPQAWGNETEKRKREIVCNT